MANYQMEYEGLVMGLGTDIGLEVIEGFEDFEVNSADTALPRGWGDVPGLHTVAAREVVLQVATKDAADFQAVLDAFQPTDLPKPLYLTEPETGRRFVYARPVGRAFTRNPIHKYKQMAAIRLKLADPRIYGDQYTHLIPLYDAGGGGGLDYDIDFGAEFLGGSTGDTTVTNNGNSDAYPTILIYAPSSGTTVSATLTNLTNGEEVSFTFSTDLSSGDIFTADMRRIVTVDPADTPYVRLGGTNRFGDWDLPRKPFRIPPGSHDIRFEIGGTGVDASAAVTFRDTSL